MGLKHAWQNAAMAADHAGVTLTQAREFLIAKHDIDPANVEYVGAGAWSRCYGFRHGGHERVIKFGLHVTDFRMDQRMYAFAGPALPIPQTFEIGEAFDGHYVISARARGTPLEQLPAEQWLTAVPAVADAMEAMRTADISAFSGYGGLDPDGHAQARSWAEYLLQVEHDPPTRRTYGWQSKLAMHPFGQATFDWGLALLKQTLADIEAPRSLLHCDMTNRNVLVEGTRLSAVFDWGCAMYGDHLYELALFEFWEPWQTSMNVALLKGELKRRWQDLGCQPLNFEARMRVCHLHNGLVHLAYNAFQESTINLEGTANRMRALME